MNAILISVLSLIVFALGYGLYARYLGRLFEINPKRPTPAIEQFDSVDYFPARNWLVLFGHHFASIAGAGPIIGPVIAVSIWGWLPVFLWILIGTIFIGGLHDFGTLVISMRNKGNSIADVAETFISKRAKFIFSSFIFLALILVVGLFVFFCAKTFVAEPRIVIPTLGLIPIAMLVGFLMYTLRINSTLVTVAGVILIILLVVLGQFVPIQLPGNALVIWGILLLVYCFIASVTPVQILLQPRDYLSAFLLFFGVFFGYLGLIVSRPDIDPSFFVKTSEANQFMWPMLFVTVACGAISGFHSLISSGTTSKQIANERHAKRVGYGGMVLEGVVAVLALLCIVGGLANRERLMWLLSSQGPGPIGAFGEGFGNLTKRVLFGFGGFFAITVLNVFMLTTLDTATRVARYVAQELFHIKNRFIATSIIVISAGVLIASGQGGRIWTVFGASNQLVAALALFVLTCWMLSRKKNLTPILIPAIFMLVTTVGALMHLVHKFWMKGDFLVVAITLALLLLAGFMVMEVLTKFIKREKKNG